MNEESLRRLVKSALSDIAPEADVDGTDLEEDLRQALDLDSMDFLNMVIALHKSTGVAIPESDYPQVFTLAGLLRYLSAHGVP